jgi:glyoxylase-like metal-dependent hydrolase (beta-lactamase superfamily II)
MTVKLLEYGPVVEWRWGRDVEAMPEPFWTSCYLVDGLLIDSGAPAGVDDLRSFTRSLGPDRRITQCVITHAHEDHAGGADMLRRELGIPILASERAVSFLRRDRGYPEYRRMVWGDRLSAVEAQPIGESVVTASGAYTFRVLPMPGHAPCLVSLLEVERQWAFVADAVLPGYRMIFGPETGIPEDIRQIYESIARLHRETAGMESLRVFVAGHGVFEGRGFLEDRLKEIEQLRDEVHAHRRRGASEQEILDRVFGGEGFIGIFTGGGLSRMNLVEGLLEWDQPDVAAGCSRQM